MLDVGAVIGDRAIDVGAAAHEVAELATEAVANRTDLAVAFLQAREKTPGVLHVADREVVVEIVIEIESLGDVLGIVVAELDARLLPPEQVGDQADKARFGKFMGMTPHRVIDSPDFHDGDDGGGGRAIGYRQIGAHHAIAQLDLNGLRAHCIVLHSFNSALALPARIRSRSAAEISSACTARSVLAMSPRPCSASNGASVANRQWPVPKNACPQRVGASSPSAVSA